MVRTPTVFVLGAGASQAYGFPSGSALAAAVCSGMSNRTSDVRRAANLFAKTDLSLLDRLEEEYRLSTRPSLDAFVEARPEFLSAVKCGIAAVLMPCEDETTLVRPEGEDWYTYLFSKIIPGDPEEFRANRLSIVTFNFDRSLERRLFLALKSSYGLKDDLTLALSKHIAPLHVHGDLGSPSWLCDSGAPDARDYGYEPNNDPNLQDVQRCADRIKIVYERGASEVSRVARERIGNTQRVCFLGFGYHPINLAKLGIPNTLIGKDVSGTSHGFSPGELHSVARTMGLTRPDAQLPGWTVQTLLKNTDLIHE